MTRDKFREKVQENINNYALNDKLEAYIMALAQYGVEEGIPYEAIQVEVMVELGVEHIAKNITKSHKEGF